MNRQYIYHMIEDLPNAEIRIEIQSIMKDGFKYGIPECNLHLLSDKITVYDTDRPDEIDKHLIKWLKEGQIYVDDSIKPLVYVPLFLKDEGNKTRLIPDFKHEVNGYSLNSLVEEEYKTVQYPSIPDLLKFVYGDGEIKALGKNDGLSFFRQINMNPSNQQYAGYYHRGITFFDGRMPWGTPRAPRVAHYLSICLEHIANKYIPLDLQPCIFSYVDDRIFRGKTQMQCLYAHMIYLIICLKAGTPIKPSKTVLVATSLVGLGVGFDLTGTPTAYVPQDKKLKYIQAFREFLEQVIATAKQTQSVVGKAEHVSWLMWPCRVYNRIFYNLIPPYQNEDQTVPITQQLRYATIQWINALQVMGPSKLQYLVKSPTTFQHTIYTDGSDIGYGGWTGTSYFYDAYYQNEVNPTDKNIRDRELYPIAIILNSHGQRFANSNILLKCDNKNAVRALINKDIRNSRSHNLVILICELAMKFGIWFHIQYIKSTDNDMADALSRLKLKTFKALARQRQIQIDPAPLLFQRLPFDFGSGIINTVFKKIDTESV